MCLESTHGAGDQRLVYNYNYTISQLVEYSSSFNAETVHHFFDWATDKVQDACI